MPAQKINTPTGPAYAVVDAHGKTTTVQSVSAANVVIANSASSITLTKTNVSDLVTVLNNFLTSGSIT